MNTDVIADDSLLDLTRTGEVAVLVIRNPPVNAINSIMRRALWNALDNIELHAGTQAVVIAADGPMFSGGGDLRELGQPENADDVNFGALARRVERYAKPVVIALHGKAIGGGVLLAMACHGRVGAADAQLALPEVNLGFVPGAGGTQRLPRLVGVEAAVRMVALSQPLDASAALAAGLLDEVTVSADDVRGAAVRMASAIAAGKRPWRRTADLPVPGGIPSPFLVDSLRAGASERFPDRDAARVAIDLIAAASLLSFDEGSERETRAFQKLSASPQTRELLAQFFSSRAEARARKATTAATEDILKDNA